MLSILQRPGPEPLGRHAGQRHGGAHPSLLPCSVPLPFWTLCTSPSLLSHGSALTASPELWCISSGIWAVRDLPDLTLCVQGNGRWSLLAEKLYCKSIYFCMNLFFFKGK